MKNHPVVLFDFDNTIANTESVRAIRESLQYHLLTNETLSEVRIYNKLRKLLHTLKEKKVKIGLITNSSRKYINALLNYLDLNNVFDVIVTHTEVGSNGIKPSPAGILMALDALGEKPSPEHIYIGDDSIDQIAAYRAGITGVLPSWASRKPISTPPSLELSTDQVAQYIENPAEYKLFAEKCAELKSANFKRNGKYFLPLDENGDVVTIKREMTTFCLGRYFSQKSPTTAIIHDNHALSKEIVKKEEQNPFQIPAHWIELMTRATESIADYAFKEGSHFDIVTIIPAKQGKDKRLERLLGEIKTNIKEDFESCFIDDMFLFSPDAKSQKTLSKREREEESNRSLHLNPIHARKIAETRVLVIDDIITTGSTIRRAKKLLSDAGAIVVMGLAIAKTVSIQEDEKTCPSCGRAMRIRHNHKEGTRFWGCTGYNDTFNPCEQTLDFFVKNCPRCGSGLKIKYNKNKNTNFLGCCAYPNCKYSEPYN